MKILHGKKKGGENKTKKPCHPLPGQDRKWSFDLIHTCNVHESVKAEKFHPVKLKICL